MADDARDDVGDGGSGADTGGARRLTLLRHGRATPPVPGADDRERALTESGRRDVVATLSHEAVRADLPDKILCSTSRRTLETARVALETLGLDAGHLESDARLYLAAPETLLEIVAEQDALGVPHLMIVGHNPGLETLGGELDGRAMPVLPTAGLYRFARRGVPNAPERTVARLLFETCPGRGG